MKKTIFKPADILLPTGVSLEKWSVIACDQFSSERDYWERVNAYVGGEPSTLRLIIPEVYLDEPVTERENGIINAMEEYTAGGIFTQYKDSFVYVERTLQDGSVRHGLIGAVDLDDYEFSGEKAAIVASEGTVRERLPVRIGIRRRAAVELPHIMSFIDDSEKTVIEPLAMIADTLPLLYDFDLMEGGGRVRGRLVSGKDAEQAVDALQRLYDSNDTLIVIGDGNHSLAAAKVFWDELKQGLSETERRDHPAGKALLEINNVYEDSIVFEAIHRMIFGVDAACFINELKAAMPEGNDYYIKWYSRGDSGDVGVSASCIGDALSSLGAFLDEYTDLNACGIDYVHGEETVKRLSQDENRVGLILPAMEKSELFGTVTSKGVFPKKSFSVGRAKDKRYYLECRRVKQR